MNLLDLFVKISVDDQASNNVETLGSKIGGGLKKAAEIGVAAVSAAATGVAALTKASIENYAEYEQLAGGVETLFKKSSDIVIGYADNAYKTAGMNANEYMDIVTGFSASLIKSLADDTAKSAEYANMAVGDLSDNSNKFGTNIESLKTAYAGFAKGQFQLLDNLKLGYGGTKEEMERLIADANRVKEANGQMADLSIDSFANIVEAIHIVQEEMGIAGATADEAKKTISGSASMMKAAWENLVTGMADENASFTNLVIKFVESVETFADNMLPRIEIALGGVVKLIEGLAPKIIDRLPSLVETVLPPLINAAFSLLDAVIEVLPSLAMTLIDVLANSLVTHIPGLVPAVVDVVIKLAMMLTDPATLINLIDASIAIILALADGILEAIPQLVEAAPVIVQRLVEALIYALPLLMETGAQIIGKLLEYTKENLPKILEAGSDIVFTIAEGVVKTFGKLFETGANIVTSIKSGFLQKIDDAKTWGKDMIDNFIGGIKEKWNSLKQTVSDVAQSVKDFLGFSEPKKGPLSNFHTYAPDMMDLFAQGVRENEHVVTDQIAKSFDFGQQTIDFAASASGRSSAAMINGMMLSDQSEEKTYVAELYLDGEKVAESTYIPMKKIAKREGAAVIA